MLELFINNISEEFKEKLLADTRKEVYKIFEGQTLTTQDKAHIEMFFVQPLYFAKLNFFANMWILENDVSIEDVIMSEKLSEDDKKLFLTTLASKLGIEFADINTTSAELLNRIFIDSGNILSNASFLKDNYSEIAKVFANTNYPEFNGELIKFCKTSFHIPYILENYKSNFEIENISNKPITQAEISEYLDKKIIPTYHNNAIILLKPLAGVNYSTATYHTNDETKTISINGYIWDLDIQASNPDNISISMENFVGFSNNSVTITIGPNNNVTISKGIYTPSASLLNDLNEKLKGVDYRILMPFKIECSLTLKNKDALESYKTNLTAFRPYEDFFAELKNIVLNSYDNDFVPKDTKARFYINPLVYKDLDFNIFGIDYFNSKLLKAIDLNLVYVKISKIYIEETDETFTF